MSNFTDGIFRPVHVPDNPEPQPVPLQDYFYQEMAPRSRTAAPREPVIAVSVCRYIDGRHAIPGPSCPHQGPGKVAS